MSGRPTIDDPIGAVEQFFGIRLKQVTESGNEWRSTSGCPQCGDGGKGGRSDRFRVFTDNSPRYWCRRCQFQGFIDELYGPKWSDLDGSARRQRILAAEIRAEEEKQRRRALRQAALQRLRATNAAEEYHEALWDNPDAINYWLGEGLTVETIKQFRLGYCSGCPMDYPNHRPSVTIPVTYQGQLWDIRHRILDAKQNNKYRPHTKHLPIMLFNADNLHIDRWYIMIVEGEKKAMAATQAGWLNVGIMGTHKFVEDMAHSFDGFKYVLVVLDPDAAKESLEIAKMFEGRGRSIVFNDKLDDLINPFKKGADPQLVWREIVNSTKRSATQYTVPIDRL